MKKLVLRWVGLILFAVLMATVFVRLGQWQWHKHLARNETNALIRTHQTLPVQQFPALFSTTYQVQDADQWQRVQVTGVYDANHQFQAMQRSVNDQAGTEIVTPLRTADGTTVLIDRGLLPRPAGQNDSTVLPAPPSGSVTVVGFVRRDERGKASAITPVNNRMLLINSAEIGKQLPYPIVNGYLQLISSTPEQAGGLVPLGVPDLGGGPYFSYAIQWFCFTAIGVLGIFIIIRTDLRERRKQQRKAALGEQQPKEHGDGTRTD